MKPTFRMGSFDPDPERDVREEIQAHLDEEVERLVAHGLSRTAAEEKARELMGNLERYEKEASKQAHARERENRFLDRFDALAQDVRYAFRRMARSPGFTGIAILSLALGIGANTAIFSLVNAVLLSGVPMRAPEELVEVYTSEPARGDEDGYPYSLSSVPDLRELRERTDLFSGVGGYEAFFSRMETAEGVQPIWGEIVSWDLFSILGMTPEAGRFFVHEEGQSYGTHPVVVLGYEFWQRQFGGSEEIVGSTISMANREWTVVGVAPKELQGFTAPAFAMDMFATYEMAPTLNFEGDTGSHERRGSRSTFMKARLAPGVTVEEAQAALSTLSANNREAYPEAWEGRSYNLVPTSEVAIHPIVDGPLYAVATLLLVVVGLVLLIACTNLAGFLLARAADRRKEIAVRLAMGARRWTLIRQLLTETLILGLLGGAAGLVVANYTLQALMAFQPPLPIPINLDVGLDRTVLFFALAVSAAAGIFFGLIPALQSTNPDVAPTLKDEGTGGGRPKRFSLKNGLVVTQVAVSMVLLLGAGLFLRSLQGAGQIDVGFTARDGGIVWAMAMGDDLTDEEFQLTAVTLEERARALPGITDVATAEMLPMGMSYQESNFDIPGVEPPAGEDHYSIGYNVVSPSYFETMGIQVVSGRGILETDRAEAEPVVVISETAARRYWPGENPLGREIKPTFRDESFRVVGVAKDTKVWTLGEEYRPYIYFPFHQFPGMNAIQLVARGNVPEAQIVGQLRTLVKEVDARLVLMEAKTMSEHLSLALFPPRMAALLLGVFGGLALILATTGLYGTVAYSVSRRGREVGIRMSLGADAGSVIRMVLKGAMGLVLVGSLIGWVVSLGLARAVQQFLYGIGAMDPVTFIGVPLVLGGVALAAALIPARRASRVNPVNALKSE